MYNHITIRKNKESKQSDPLYLDVLTNVKNLNFWKVAKHLISSRIFHAIRIGNPGVIVYL